MKLFADVFVFPKGSSKQVMGYRRLKKNFIFL